MLTPLNDSIAALTTLLVEQGDSSTELQRQIALVATLIRRYKTYVTPAILNSQRRAGRGRELLNARKRQAKCSCDAAQPPRSPIADVPKSYSDWPMDPRETYS